METPAERIKKVKALEWCLDSFKGDRTQIINRLEQEKDRDVRSLLTGGFRAIRNRAPVASIPYVFASARPAVRVSG